MLSPLSKEDHLHAAFYMLAQYCLLNYVIVMFINVLNYFYIIKNALLQNFLYCKTKAKIKHILSFTEGVD